MADLMMIKIPERTARVADALARRSTLPSRPAFLSVLVASHGEHMPALPEAGPPCGDTINARLERKSANLAARLARDLGYQYRSEFLAALVDTYGEVLVEELRGNR